MDQFLVFAGLDGTLARRSKKGDSNQAQYVHFICVCHFTFTKLWVAPRLLSEWFQYNDQKSYI